MNIILHGCLGAMGRELSSLVKESAAENHIIICAGIDRQKADTALDYPVYSHFNDLGEDIKKTADVIIDFSTATAIDALLDFTERQSIPLVLCTTNLSLKQLARINALSDKTAVLRSANMSLGINLLTELVSGAAKILYSSGFNIEIIEKHHKRKIDAPSGTAISISEAVNAALGNKLNPVYCRTDRQEARPENEIGIASVRGGSMAGEHEVIFAGEDEIISFTHTALSRKIFAKGALKAAEFIASRQKGLYSMKDVIRLS